MEFAKIDTFYSYFPKMESSIIDALLKLKEENKTPEYIAYYCQEKTKGLPYHIVKRCFERHDQWQFLVKKKQELTEILSQQNLLTDEMKKEMESISDKEAFEVLSRPYKKRKQNKVTQSRQAGLDKFSDWIWSVKDEEDIDTSLEVKAKEFTQPEKGFAMPKEVLEGAQSLLVEKIFSDQELRDKVKKEIYENSHYTCEKGLKYKPGRFDNYLNYKEKVKALFSKKGYRDYLNIHRAKKQNQLKADFQCDEELILKMIEEKFSYNKSNKASRFLDETLKKAMKVHIIPSVTNEIHVKLKKDMDKHYIETFNNNFKQTLSTSKCEKNLLAINFDKNTIYLVLLDSKGQFISWTGLSYDDKLEEEFKKLIGELAKQMSLDFVVLKYKKQVKALHQKIKSFLADLKLDIPISIFCEPVSKVYADSEVSKTEFPDLSLEVKEALSLGRAFQNAAFEILKLDVKKVLISPYQSDLSDEILDENIKKYATSHLCYHGVNLNQATAPIFKYLPKITEELAQNFVSFREKQGRFKERADVLKVEGMTQDIYDEVVGFLRLDSAVNPLDKTGIHPRFYQSIKDALKESNVLLSDIFGKAEETLKPRWDHWSELIGEFNLKFIVKELDRSQREPKKPSVFEFDSAINELKDVKSKSIYKGLIANATHFGFFVDIGIDVTGLVHISEISHHFISNPSQVLKIGQPVKVRVLKTDEEKKLLFLSLKLSDKEERQTRSAPARSKGKGKGKSGGKEARKGKPKFKSSSKKFSPKPKEKFNNPFEALKDLKK